MVRSKPRPTYTPSTEEQRRAVEAQRNRKRLARYHNLMMYREAAGLIRYGETQDLGRQDHA